MNTEFDEIVVGKSNGDFMSKMEEEYNKIKQMEMEEEKKPLEERIKSKNWKTRKNAFTEILDQLKAEKCFAQYEKIYIQILDDPHPSAQETALEIVKYLLENFENISPLIPDLFKTTMEKCYTLTRSNLKQKCREILVLSLEVSMDSKCQCEIIKDGIENKNSKIQQASLNILTHIISLFGSYKIEYRGILSSIEKIADNLCSTPALRTELIELYKELFRWMKDSVKNHLSKFKENLQKDLEKAFEEINANPKFVTPKPTKFFKCDKDKITNQLGKRDEIKSKMLLIQEEAKIFKNTEAVELFQGKYNPDWAEDLLSKDRKWMDKKDMLEKFINDSNVFKINNSSKAHIVQCFLKLLKDNNINVVSCTIMAINNMAKGLRKDFIEAREFITPLIDKFKEKKEKIVSDVFVCLDSIMTHCFTMDEVIDDFREYIKSDKTEKTTQIKERFCIFVEKTVTKTFISILRKVAKALSDIMFVLSEDASPDVRNAALKTIGVIKFRVGEMLISKVLNDLCDIKKKKVDEAAKNVTVDPIYDKDDKAGAANLNKKMNALSNNTEQEGNSTKNTPGLNNINKNKQVTKNAVITADVEMTDMTGADTNSMENKNGQNYLRNNLDDVEMAADNIGNNNIPIKPPMQRSLSTNNIKANNPPKMQNKPNSNSVAGNTASNSNIGNHEVDIDMEEDNNLSNEEIEGIIKEKIGNENYVMFNDSKWENRKNAFVSLANFVSSHSDEINKLIDILLRFMKIKLKDYKENNFNIIKEAINVILNLCEFCNNFQKKHCVIMIKKLSEKLGDNKLKQNVLNMFFKFMEYHGPKYITNILLKHMTNNVKSPNVLKEFSAFLEKVIEDFGIAILPIKEIVEFGKSLASNANPQLRNSATTLFCEIYKYLGANIKKFLKDVKEATLKIIESEFEKITVFNSNSNPEIKRELKGNACLELQNNSNTNVLDSLFPKVDISKKISSKLIKDLNEGKWQIKKEALESIEKIFQDANMRIMPIGLNELVNSLKNKLDDGNKNMVRSMIQFITKMVEALGKDSKTFSKILLSPILRNLSDKMNLLREDVLKCLEKWSEMIGFESILHYCPQYLLIDNYDLRTDLLKLILKYKIALVKYDTKELIPGVLSCLLDKTPSIRNLAEDLAKETLKIININHFYLAMKDFKPAIANTIKGIIEKYSSLICVEPSTENVIDKDMNTLNINQGASVNNNPNNLPAQSFKMPIDMHLNQNNLNNMVNNSSNQHQRSMSANINNNNNNNKPNINGKLINQNQNQNNLPNNQGNKSNNLNNLKDQGLNKKNKRDSNSSKESSSKEKDKKGKTGPINNNLNPTSQFPKNTINIKPIDVDSIIQETSLKTISSSIAPLLINSNIKFNQKNKRLENEKKLAFPNQFITSDYDSTLKTLMLNFFNKSQVEALYSNEVTKINSFFSQVNTTMKSDPILLYEVTDILLKWILIRNIEMNNNLFFNNIIFEFFKNLVQFLNENECNLFEIENKILIEILVSKIFTVNPNNKLKSKQFFTEFCSGKVFKLEIILDMLVSKINSIYDMEMKHELMELLNNLANVLNYNLEDINRLRLLVCLLENVAEDNLKSKVFDIIKNIFEKFSKDNSEENSKSSINEILNSSIFTSKLINKQNIQNKNNNNLTTYAPSNNQIELNKPSHNLQSYFKPNPNLMDKNAHVSAPNFSKSPILSLVKKIEENSSKESFHIKLIETFDQNKIDLMLNCFTSSETPDNEKIKNFLELSDIFTNKLHESVVILEKNIDKILMSLRDMTKQIFFNTDNLGWNNKMELLKYLLTVYYKAALAKDVVEHCQIDTVYNTYEEILRAILYEGLESVGELEEGKKIIKSLNALVLKFMENFNTTFTFVALIKLIQYYCSDNSRICSLSIKCLLKLSNIMPSIIASLEIEKILIAIFEFIYEFEKTHEELNTSSQNEEMCLKILRTIIHEIIKIKNEGIWNYYKAAIERNNLPDKFLKRWIQLIMRSKNGLSLPSTNSSSAYTSSPMVHKMLNMKSTSSNILNYSANQPQNISISAYNNANYLLNSNSYANNTVNEFDNELNFYLEKLKKEMPQSLNTNDTHGNVNEQLFCELIAIIKRNSIPLEYVKEKMNDFDYSTLKRIFNTVTNNEGSETNSHPCNSNNTSEKISNNVIVYDSKAEEKVRDFDINPDRKKENLNINMNSNANINSSNYSSNIANINRMEKIDISFNPTDNPSSNIQNNSIGNASRDSSQNLQIKTLQEYRNRLHGISANKSNTLFNNTNSPSPIKPTNPSVDDVNMDKKQQYIDNFYKNKEMLRNNTKRDFSSEVRPNVINSNNNDQSGSQFFDKLAEMKKRLQLLRSQKY